MNLDGEVVGINTMILSDIRTDAGKYISIGLGFAIPIDSAFDRLEPAGQKAVPKNKAENMAQKAEKAREEYSRAEKARVAAEDSENAQAAAKEKVERDVAKMRGFEKEGQIVFDRPVDPKKMQAIAGIEPPKKSSRQAMCSYIFSSFSSFL